MAVVHCWVGAVTSTTAWVRGKVSGASVRVAYSTSPTLAWPSYTVAAAPTLNIASHSITGLTAQTQYYFALEVDGVLDTDFSGKFRTHATVGTPFSFTFAASSCAGNSVASEDGDDGLAYIVSRMSDRPIFDTIREQDPEFFVHLGDMHYEDITSGTNAAYRTAFDDVLTFNGTKTWEARQGRLYRNVPLAYVWDDHDYSDNDSDGSYAGKAAPAAVFRERVPHYTLSHASACYQEFKVGRVQFIMTDSRYFRDLAGGTMLGATQMTWLQNVLSTSTAKFLIFVTQMQWHSGSATQSWPGYPAERATIAGWLSTYGWTNRMHMLTGDGHELGIDTGASNTAGGFPVHQLSALDSGGGVSGSDFNKIHRGGRDQWGRIVVDDNGTRINVTVQGMVLDQSVAEHTVSIVTDVTAPSAPTSLSVTGVTPSTVSLTWAAATDDVGVVGYQVLRGATEAGWTFTTSFKDEDLSPSTGYTYTVKAVDAASLKSSASSSVLGTTTSGTEPALMAWPDTILGSKVEMSIGGTWTDITGDVYGSSRGEIQITRGSSNESGESLEPGVCTFTLNNAAGKYSPRNTRSVYYGLIGRNTPVRVWAPGPTAHLNIPWATTLGRARIATTTSMDLTNDLEVQVELALDSIPAQDPTTFAADEQGIVGRWDAADKNWVLVVDYVGRLRLYWSPDGVSFLSASSTAQAQYSAGQRFAIKATLDVNNGASGRTCTFYTSDLITGTWTQLGDAVVQAGTTSIQNDTADLMLGKIEGGSAIAGSGRYYKVKVLNGIGGTALVNADFTALNDGAAGLTDTAGRTWLFENGATLTHLHQRFYGEVANWPLEWEEGGFDVWSTISAFGVARRLGQGAKPIQSALRRSIENTLPLPVAYWPLEDGINSDAGGPGLDGIINLGTSGFDFASTSDQLGSKPVATLGNTCTMSGTTFNAEQGNWHFEFIYKLESMPATERLFARFRMSGGPIERIDVHIKTGQVRQRGYDDEGNLIYTNTITDATGVGLFPGQWNRFRLFSVNDYPTAADVTFVMAWETCIDGFYWSGWNNTTGTTPGAPAGLSGTWTDDVFDGMGIGHIAVWDNVGTGVVGGSGDGFVPRSFDGADHGYSGEYAVLRLGRLAEESRVRLVSGFDGQDTEMTRMGPQTPDSFLGNIQAVADSDMGRLFELRHAPSLYYRPRFQLYNQATALELDYHVSGQICMPFAPIDDDQQVRNDVTVEREGGSSARSTVTTGPLSNLDPPLGVGTYDESVTLSLYNEDMPRQFADWRVHLGTWDEARFPTITMNLRKATTKIEDWLNFEIGDIFSVSNLPTWMPPDTLLLRMEGYTETINAFGWDVVMNCSPARPYRVGKVGEAILGHLDTAGCVTAEAMDTTETGMDVTTTLGPIWTTAGADLPFNVRVGGEVMTVTAISGATAAQTMTVTRSVNGVVKSHLIGATVKLDEPARVALG